MRWEIRKLEFTVEISLVTKKMCSHYNYEKGFLFCYKQNAGDFSIPFSAQSWGVEKGQVFPAAQGVTSL